MAYKSILTVISDKKSAKSLLDQASTIAALHDAHLDILCLGIDRTQIGYYYAGANAMILQEAIDKAGTDAKELEALTTEVMTGAAVRWSTDTDVAQLGDIGRHLAWRARFADLVILPRPYGEEAGAELESIIETSLFEGQTAVAVLPMDKPFDKEPGTILIAWNETPEALSAVRKSMPALQRAASVHIVVIDPPAHGAQRSDPGGMLATWLARHGVSAEIEVISKTLPTISEQINRHAQDIEADLVVMGAYSHSRFREAILGGATRNMLTKSLLPIFMAH